MRIFYWSDATTIGLSFILWPILQILAAVFCHLLPKQVLSPNVFFFRAHSFEEEGEIYQRLLRVRHWKGKAPDGGSIVPGTFKKKHLEKIDPDTLRQFLLESCRAELIHWLAIPPFVLFGFFVSNLALALMFLYAVGVNLPFVVIQRYNRPRVQRLLKRLEEKNKHGNQAVKTNGPIRAL